MNAHDRRIFARKCKRLGVTTKPCTSLQLFWIPLINNWHVDWDSPHGVRAAYLPSRITALRYALNHAEQS